MGVTPDDLQRMTASIEAACANLRIAVEQRISDAVSDAVAHTNALGARLEARLGAVEHNSASRIETFEVHRHKTTSQIDKIAQRLLALEARTIDAETKPRVDQLEAGLRELSQAYGAAKKSLEETKKGIGALDDIVRKRLEQIDSKLRVDFARDLGAVREEVRGSVADVIATIRRELMAVSEAWENHLRSGIADLRSELKLEIDDAMQALVSRGGFVGRAARAVRAAWQELR